MSSLDISRGSCLPSYWTQVSCIAGRFSNISITREEYRFMRLKAMCLQARSGTLPVSWPPNPHSNLLQEVSFSFYRKETGSSPRDKQRQNLNSGHQKLTLFSFVLLKGNRWEVRLVDCWRVSRRWLSRSWRCVTRCVCWGEDRGQENSSKGYVRVLFTMV